MSRTITSAIGQGQKLAVVEVVEQYARKVVNSGEIKIRWEVCRVRIRLTPTKCYRCLDYGNTSDIGLSKRTICRTCGQVSHQAKIPPPPQERGNGFVCIICLGITLTLNETIPGFRRRLNALEDAVLGKEGRILVGGDFNARATLKGNESQARSFKHWRPGYEGNIPDINFGTSGTFDGRVASFRRVQVTISTSRLK